MPYRTTREHFEEIAEAALKSIPARFRRRFKNISIVVEDYPSQDVIEKTGIPRNSLLGLFSGQRYGDKDLFFNIPYPYPDTIFLYQKNIESICASEEAVRKEVRSTMLHEVGHYFGMSEEDLEELEEGDNEA